MARRQPRQSAPRANTAINDSLMNVVANLGTGRDKAAHTYYATNPLSAQELLTTYQNSWLAAAIVDYPAEDATRKWRKWRAKVDQITKIEELEKKLGLQSKVCEAMIAARLYKAAAIYINTRDSDQASPLKAGTEIVSLVVLTSNVLTPDQVVRDIDSPYYGQAEYFTIATDGDKSQQKIHASRFAMFYGAKIPGDVNTATADGWGANSIIQSTMDAIKNVDATMANVASLVFEAKVDVFKFEGFAELLANTANDAMVTRRLVTQAAMKSINGAVVIDAKDDYQQKSASFNALSDVIREFKDAASGAARIPVTRLFGRSSGGLNATGDGDERVYYDRIEHEQKTSIGGAIGLVDECLITQALGVRPPDVYAEWAPLRQMTQSERADIFSKTATAARTLAGPQGEIVPIDALSDAVVNELTEQGALPGLDQAIAKYGSLSEQGFGREVIE